MRYDKKSIRPNTSASKFADMVNLGRLTSTEPVKEVVVGYKFYNELLGYFENQLMPSKSKAKKTPKYLTNIFGIDVKIDPSIKEGEFKVGYENKEYDEDINYWCGYKNGKTDKIHKLEEDLLLLVDKHHSLHPSVLKSEIIKLLLKS